MTCQEDSDFIRQALGEIQVEKRRLDIKNFSTIEDLAAFFKCLDIPFHFCSGENGEDQLVIEVSVHSHEDHNITICYSGDPTYPFKKCGGCFDQQTKHSSRYLLESIANDIESLFENEDL